MTLNKNQYNFLCEIYCFFLSLERRNIKQSYGYLRQNYEHIGCFGSWLAYLYDLKDKEDNTYGFVAGMDKFDEALDIYEIAPEFRKFMQECGASEYPFSNRKWKLLPHKVIRNMLEKGA